MSLEERVAKIEGILEQMDKRLNHIESEIAGLRGEIVGLRDEMSRKFDSLFKWTVGLILGMWISVILTLVPILLKILGVI